MTCVYELNERYKWSQYATDLYTRLHKEAVHGKWCDRLHYLLYEGGIYPSDAPRFAGLDGVLLQDPRAKVSAQMTDASGWSRNMAIRALQKYEGHGMVWP